MDDDNISNILENMGIEKEYKGFYFLTDAIEIIAQDETALLNIGRRIYNPIACKYNCNRAAVEKNMHTAILKAWKNNKRKVENTIGKKFTSPPKVSEFIDCVSYYVYKVKKGLTNQKF